MRERCHGCGAPRGGQSPSPLQTLQDTRILLFCAMLPPHPDTSGTQQELFAPSSLTPVTPEQLWALHPDLLRSQTRKTPAHPPLLPSALPHFPIPARRGLPGRSCPLHTAPRQGPAGPAASHPRGHRDGPLESHWESPTPGCSLWSILREGETLSVPRERRNRGEQKQPHHGLSDYTTGIVGKGLEKPTLISPWAASS